MTSFSIWRKLEICRNFKKNLYKFYYFNYYYAVSENYLNFLNTHPKYIELEKLYIFF